tara:strand:+ start:15611 stop:15916 length:306 start_codon:yes stop_codon:yes gene_type:complete
MAPSTKLNDNSEITIPIRNLIALIIATAIGVMGYSNLTERLSFVEHSLVLQTIQVDQNSEFRTLWPRGELGALPDDAEQNIRLDFLEKQLEGVLEKMEADE